ncbi:MAG: hypothetical protein ACI8W8_002552 [Rhodothermales bacterium]|jgi:hypothetical protein
MAGTHVMGRIFLGLWRQCQHQKSSHQFNRLAARRQADEAPFVVAGEDASV